MTNRDLLQAAIADAKAVKEMAISNAKAALEESLAPHLREMFSEKIQEMEKEDDKMKEAEVTTEEVVTEEDSMSEEELNELLAELEEEATPVNEEEKKESEEEETEKETEEESEEETEEESDEEEINLDEMSEEELKAFIEDVVDEMIAAGELEAGHDGMEDEAGAEEETGEEVEIEMEEGKEDLPEPPKEDRPGGMFYEEDKAKMEKELEEAYAAIETLKSELHEINLLNSKLLYTNKIFKAKSLSEAQKVKVLETFDKAESVKEVKLVYETLVENLSKSVKKQELVKENKSFASKAVGTSSKQPVVESNDMVNRFKKLAGL